MLQHDQATNAAALMLKNIAKNVISGLLVNNITYFGNSDSLSGIS